MEQSKIKTTDSNKLVVTCGTFDGIPHPGHLEMLKTCGKWGRLVVMLTHDDAVRRNKKREPIYPQCTRKENLLKTGLVNEVVRLTGDPLKDLRLVLDLQPEVFCFGEDQLDGLALDIDKQLSKTKCDVKWIARYKPDLYSTTALYFTRPSSEKRLRLDWF
jgi:cytidyltransferase-like protein